VLVLLLLGLELALTRGPVALVGSAGVDCPRHDPHGGGRFDVDDAAFCLVRGLPVLVEGWKYIAANVGGTRSEWCSAGGGVKGPGEVQEVNEVNG